MRWNRGLNVFSKPPLISVFMTQVSSTVLWRSPQYRAIFQVLDDSGGFYLCRWGDGPIHLLAVMLLLEDEQVLKFARVPYWHQTFVAEGLAPSERPSART